MITSAAIINKFNNVVNLYGQPVRFKFYNPSGALLSYDDDVVLTQIGSPIFVNGLCIPIDAKKGSNEAVLMEQGKLATNDSKLYVPASINTSGIVKVGLGSPNFQEYSIVDTGVNTWNITGDNTYKKVYIRILTTGSLIGE